MSHTHASHRAVEPFQIQFIRGSLCSVSEDLLRRIITADCIFKQPVQKGYLGKCLEMSFLSTGEAAGDFVTETGDTDAGESTISMQSFAWRPVATSGCKTSSSSSDVS